MQSILGSIFGAQSPFASGMHGLELDELEPAISIKPLPTKHQVSKDIVTACIGILESYRNVFPRSIAQLRLRSGAQFEISRVYKNGMVVGAYRDGKNVFNIFTSEHVKMPPAGCSCEDSDGQYPCVHGYNFIQFVIDKLKASNSQLANRIRSGQFDMDKVDESIFKFDNSQLTIRLLDNLILNAPADQDFDSINVPVSTTTAERTRLSWNVEVTHGKLGLEPMLQQARKRGGGWTKGRRISLSSLFDENMTCLSDLDLQIRKLVKINAYHYSGGYTLDPCAAMFELIGQDNVTWDGVPIEVLESDGVIETRKDKSGFQFFCKDMTSQSFSAVSENYLLVLNQGDSKISVYRGTPAQTTCMRELLKFDSIPDHREKEFFERAKKIQRMVNLELPTEVAGSIEPEPAQPLIVLRSRKDGALDYGIRVRDSQDRLCKPAEGVMIRSAIKDNRPVQYYRSLKDERHVKDELIQRLDLNEEQTDGTIADFGAALDLIEKLQTSESQVEVLWDKASEAPIQVLGTVSSQNVRVGISQKRDWFNLTGSCQLGDKEFDITALLDGLRADDEGARYGDFVKLKDGGWARISNQLRSSLSQLRDAVNQDRGTLRFDRTSALAMRDMQQHFQIEASRAWNDCLTRLARSEKLEPVLPEGLNATLRDYQVDGYRWLRRLAEWGVGGVLADDMGLGKTLQTLAVVLDRAKEGPALVIAPTSVGFNWMREIEKFTPQLNASLYRETDRSDFLDAVGENQIVVCSYGLALRDAEKLAKVKWATMVLDEAQAIKNSRSKTSMAIATIPSQWTVALTGTPVENHLGELWSLFHVVAPGVFGGWDQFRQRFAAPIERDNDDERRQALRKRLEPFVLRRTKKEVLKDLPARTEMNLYVELSPAERKLYDEIRLSALGEVDTIAKLTDIKDQRFKILALLTRLRQIACHPRMVHENWSEGSAKLTQLSETLLQLRDEGHRVLIFSQFVKHLTLIREMLDTEKVSYQYLDGSTPAAARQVQVDQFQNGEATAFLISLKAGGTGLNLTAADYVIHMDPWWNPAVEDQATDRAHRIGQQKPVMVYRIVAQNTIEEEILRLHETKRDLVAGVLDGTHSAGKLSTDDLLALLRS